MKAGRTKQRLAKLLSKRLGVTVDPNDMWTNRNAEMVGCARWGVWVTIDKCPVNVYSWDTMTECLNKGFVVSRESDSLLSVVVNDPA